MSTRIQFYLVKSKAIFSGDFAPGPSFPQKHILGKFWPPLSSFSECVNFAVVNCTSSTDLPPLRALFWHEKSRDFRFMDFQIIELLNKLQANHCGILQFHCNALYNSYVVMRMCGFPGWLSNLQIWTKQLLSVYCMAKFKMKNIAQMSNFCIVFCKEIFCDLWGFK